MKSILFIVCFLPFVSVAQDCKVLRETDPFTKETRVSSGFIDLQKASVTIDSDNKEVDFFFTIEGKCFNDASNVVIFYEGTKLKSTYRNTGSMNCDGYFHFKFRNGAATPANLQKLAAQKVTQLIFTGDDKKPVAVTPTPEQQQQFMEAAACVTSEAKKLIK